jgi:enolase-phosphatase E1
VNDRDRPPSLSAAGIRVVLLDIEGTTTPMAFVHDVLFPYARARVRMFLEGASADPQIQQLLDDLRREHTRDRERNESPPVWDDTSPSTWLASVVSYTQWLMDRDSKAGPLKALQGKIWERGYSLRELQGDVYPDVRGALERWTSAGVRVGIFSSGSVLAQKLLFANSTAGDLTPFLRWYFDTAVGAKVEDASYRRIVAALAVPADRVLFISDVIRELDAARAAGLRTLLSVRPPASAPAAPTHPAVRTFAEVVV